MAILSHVKSTFLAFEGPLIFRFFFGDHSALLAVIHRILTSGKSGSPSYKKKKKKEKGIDP